ncbi:MAG: AbrB/MazE/SpoVT family DNA-binding domain-containing protein [Defluviitaleaceae bacterium]|nr:AbrB/MazE/SpoVT family DNA-binding domain-containing protein [Defluviitaleaceae bacterium]
MTLDYTRKIDELGRIVIPQSLRQTLGWEMGDTLSLYCTDDATALCIMKVDKKPECIANTTEKYIANDIEKRD